MLSHLEAAARRAAIHIHSVAPRAAARFSIKKQRARLSGTFNNDTIA
jgi:hypothetical protein